MANEEGYIHPEWGITIIERPRSEGDSIQYDLRDRILYITPPKKESKIFKKG